LERPNCHTAFAFDAVAQECRRLGITSDTSNSHAFDAVKLAREEAESSLADALLCPSDFVASTHALHGTSPARLVRHRYGYDPLRFPLGDQSADGRFTALFVGGVEPRKGLHTALDAWIAGGLGEAGQFYV